MSIGNNCKRCDAQRLIQDAATRLREPLRVSVGRQRNGRVGGRQRRTRFTYGPGVGAAVSRISMLRLHGFVPAWGLPDFSPFCNKVHTYLRMRGLEYQTMVADPRKAPLGKLPGLELEDGTMVYDSRLIIERMESENPEPMDAHLSARERAIGEVLRSAWEEHFYFVLAYLHFQYDRGWEEFLPVWRDYGNALRMPAFVFHPALFFARRNVLRDLRGQGMGRHDVETVWRFGKGLITSLADLIGEGPFLLGERPTTYDATAYAFTASILKAEFTCPVREHALAQESLRAYRDRMYARYFAA